MNCRGMTLLEVMVALMLLAIAGLALIKTSNGQMRSLSYLEQRQVAYWVADNQLTLLWLQPGKLEQNWQHGSSEMAGERWFWRWRGVSTSNPSLQGVEIEVRQQQNSPRVLAYLHSWRSNTP